MGWMCTGGIISNAGTVPQGHLKFIFGNKGWMGVDNDPTAKAVADRYCSLIESLPKEGIEEGRTILQNPQRQHVD